MVNKRIVQYDANDAANDPESKERMYHAFEYKGTNRRIKIGVAQDGYIFIKTRRLINGEVVVSTICYSREAVERILDAIKRGTESWEER